ncbi:hypothetical protein AN958_12437 [Leucoagaricus sp. SymC.cos]|nr:hypothetical protein AN958_12437 [Leucoagaricus sp. SymC.cos]
MCTRNRGNLSGSISLDFGLVLPCLPGDRQYLDAVGSELFLSGGASKLDTLLLYSPPTHWLRALRRRCTTLLHLILSWDQSYYLEIDPSTTWRRNLRVELPWRGLTQLQLRSVPVDVCFELLTGCPDLTHFSSDNDLPRTGPDPVSDGQIILSKLEYLRWFPWHRNLHLYTFPALQCISTSEWDNSLQDSLCEYLSRNNDLDAFELTLESRTLISARVAPILKSIPRLRHLICTDIPPVSLSMVFRILLRTTCFRYIRVITSRHTAATKVGSESWFVNGFYDMVKGKQVNEERTFRFETENLLIDWEVFWKEDRFMRLKEDGFRLEVFHNGHAVDV